MSERNGKLKNVSQGARNACNLTTTTFMTQCIGGFKPLDYRTNSYPVSHSPIMKAANNEVDTRWLLDLSEFDDSVVGVVGWINFESISSYRMLEVFSSKKKFRGVRTLLREKADEDYILSTDFGPIFDFLSSNRLILEVSGSQQHLHNIAILANKYPRLSIIIDDFAQLIFEESNLEEFKSNMEAFRDLPNVYIKVTELSSVDSRRLNGNAMVSQFIQATLDVFGHGRMMWISTSVEVFEGHESSLWKTFFIEFINSFTETQRQAFWVVNAEKIYT